MSNIQLVENLYRLRKAHHYTQQEISDLLNISRQAYSNYETSKRTPDLDSLMRLADIYGVSLDQLVNHPCTKDGSDFLFLLFSQSKSLVNCIDRTFYIAFIDQNRDSYF